MQNSDDSPSGPDDRDEPRIDPTEATFEDWIDHVADAEGVPPEAVRARLMSSYWILDELARHMEDTDFEDLSDELAAEEFTATASDDWNDRVRTILEELVEDARSIEPRQRPDPQQPSWERLVEMVESLDGFDEPEPNRAADEPSPPASGAEATDRSVRELQEQVEAVQRRTAERHDELSNRIDDIADTLEQSAGMAELDAVERDVMDRLAELEASIQTVDAEMARLDEALSEQTDDVSDIDQRLEAHADQLQALQETLSTQAETLEAIDGLVDTNRDRLEAVEATTEANADSVRDLRQSVSTHETELENAEKIFRHLFTQLERLEDRTSVIGHALDDLEPVMAAHYERQQVDSLKKTAAKLGSPMAECETCEHSVDIGLLTEPVCPYCKTPADGVVSRSGLLRSKTVLETAEGTDEPEPAADWAGELAALDLDRSTDQGSADADSEPDG